MPDQPEDQDRGLIKIDNKSINQTIQQNQDAAPLAYNQYAGLQQLATVTDDGIYRVYDR